SAPAKEEANPMSQQENASHPRRGRWPGLKLASAAAGRRKASNRDGCHIGAAGGSVTSPYRQLLPQAFPATVLTRPGPPGRVYIWLDLSGRVLKCGKCS